MQIPRTALTAIVTLLAISTPFTDGKTTVSSTLLADAPVQVSRKVQADQFFQQGIEQYQKGQPDAAIQSWQQALSIYRQVQDLNGEGAALANLGAAYLELEKYSKTVESLQPFLAIARATGNRRGEAQALGNLGIAYNELGNYVKAIESHQQALMIMQATQDRQGEGQVLANLGNAYEALGDYDKALQPYQQSLTIARQVKDRPGEGTALGNLGAIYADKGDYNKAIEFYQLSLVTQQAIDDQVGQANTLNNLGVAYQAQGNLKAGVDYYTKSLALAQKTHNRRLESVAIGSLGLAYEKQGNYNKAVENYKQSLAIAQELSDPRLQGLSLNNLGHAFFKSGQLQAAETYLRNAVQLLDSLRPGLSDTYKVSIFDTQVFTYNLLQKVLIAQNKPDSALEIAERGRARAFVELLQARLSNQVTTQAGINLPPPTIGQIQQTAQQHNATLVEYSIAPEEPKETVFQGKRRGKPAKLFIWVTSPTGNVAFRQVNLQPLRQEQQINLEELVVMSRNDLGVRGRGLQVVGKVNAPNQSKRLQQLHNLLIQPIADLLPKDPNARVIFVPQEFLFLVPFPALQDTSGKYLIEQHTILTVPAIQVLDLTYRQRQRIQGLVKDVLVVGNPTMPKISLGPGQPPQQLPSLPGAEQEAMAIANLLHTKAIIRDQATKVDIVRLLPKARLIHLATHGLLDDVQSSDIPGAIALAPSNRDDGLLRASEIFNLKLNAELVVLSACDTGQGKITGDGVIGLSRSLISAGVPSVIVSLWSVPDAPTASLMTEFYRQFQHKSDKAQALRMAMLKTMAQHPEPKDWAAFTLIGEP